MNRLLAFLLVAFLLGTAPASAAVQVQRTGSENPMQEVAKSVIYGGLAGLIVGSALAIADEGGNDGDYIRWGFAGGTFFGLGFGIYHVTSRPRGDALLELDGGKLRLGAITPRLDPRTGARVTLVAARF